LQNSNAGCSDGHPFNSGAGWRAFSNKENQSRARHAGEKVLKKFSLEKCEFAVGHLGYFYTKTSQL
jgi:peptide methionine sulfoxide reductase MsrB